MTRHASLLLVPCLVVAIAGCGDSTPVSPPPQAGQSDVAAGPAPAATATQTTSAKVTLVPFAASLEGAAASDDCALDAVNGARSDTYTLPRDAIAQVAGWVADRKSGNVPANAQVILEAAASFGANLPVDQARPDVAAALGNPAFAAAGYSVGLELADVAPGNYRFAIAYTGSEGLVVCRPKTSIMVV